MTVSQREPIKATAAVEKTILTKAKELDPLAPQPGLDFDKGIRGEFFDHDG